ncbi:MAG TPA: MFS transporter [Actinomycetota bacterium]|nr:MFS transporter [Actinomycetota bacterium]
MAAPDGQELESLGTWQFIQALPRETKLFMAVAAVSQVGSTGSLLAITTIAADAAPTTRQAANYTSALFFVMFGVAALAMPYTALVSRRLGVLKSFAAIQVAACLLWLAVAGLIALGAPGYPVLLGAAVLAGALRGWGMTLGQLSLSCYAPTAGRARSIALMSSSQGLGAVIGGPVGGLLVDLAGPLAVIVFNALSFLPVAWVVLAVVPLRAPKSARMQEKPWRAIWASMRSSSAIRGAVVVAVGSALMIGPLSQMMVPLARDLGHNLALHAGILIGALAAGNLLAPVLLPRLQHSIRAVSTAKAYTIAAGAMVCVSLFAYLLDGGAELVTLGLVFIVFAAGSTTGRSFLVDFVEIESAEEERTRNLSTYFLAIMVGVTLGSLVWGQLLSSAGGFVTLLSLSIGMLLMTVYYWRSLLRSAREAEAGNSPSSPPPPER